MITSKKGVKKLEWHGDDWVAMPFDLEQANRDMMNYGIKSFHSYKKYKSTYIARFIDDSCMKRVVELWNVTRHLSDKDFKFLIKKLANEQKILIERCP